MAFTVKISVPQNHGEVVRKTAASSSFTVAAPNVKQSKVIAPAVARMNTKTHEHKLENYIKLFDDKLKEEAEHVQVLYFFPLENARRSLKEMFYSDKIAKSTLAQQAKLVAVLTRTLQNFWSRAEYAMDAIDGKIMSDEVAQSLAAEKAETENEYNKILNAIADDVEQKLKAAAENEDKNESSKLDKALDDAMQQVASDNNKKKRGRPKKANDMCSDTQKEIAKKMRQEQKEEDNLRFRDAMKDFYHNK